MDKKEGEESDTSEVVYVPNRVSRLRSTQSNYLTSYNPPQESTSMNVSSRCSVDKPNALNPTTASMKPSQSSHLF